MATLRGRCQVLFETVLVSYTKATKLDSCLKVHYSISIEQGEIVEWRTSCRVAESDSSHL